MSVLLDTNLLSELLLAAPNRSVLAWFAAQAPEGLFVSAITEAEMLVGVRLLPAGRRRNTLETAIRAMFTEDFAGRILPFDSAAAHVYADVIATRRAAGRPISQFDAQIAAIARHHGIALATRNVSDFEDCAIDVIDPWS